MKTDWKKLYESADAQGGYFTLAQANEANFSSQAINKHLGNRMERVRRGVYRLGQYPEHDQAELIVFWLWTEKIGVFSHDTALFLYDLSDALPRYTTITVPLAWKTRRLTIPEGLNLRHSATKPDSSWIDVVPVTTYLRTLEDCKKDPLLVPFFEQALIEVEERSLLTDENIQKLKGLE